MDTRTAIAAMMLQQAITDNFSYTLLYQQEREALVKHAIGWAEELMIAIEGKRSYGIHVDNIGLFNSLEELEKVESILYSSFNEAKLSIDDWSSDLVNQETVDEKELVNGIVIVEVENGYARRYFTAAGTEYFPPDYFFIRDCRFPFSK